MRMGRLKRFIIPWGESMGIVILNNKVLVNQNKIAMYIPPFEPHALNLDMPKIQYTLVS